MIDIMYVPFDVHKSTISSAALNLEGKLVTQAVIQTDFTAVRHFLRGISGSVHLTFEEGTHAQWLYDLTRPLVSALVACNARQASSKGNKSDRLEALKVAQLLRAGMLKGVYHGSTQTQTLKQLSHNYDSITSDTTRCMNRLKSLYRSRAVACSGSNGAGRQKMYNDGPVRKSFSSCGGREASLLSFCQFRSRPRSTRALCI